MNTEFKASKSEGPRPRAYPEKTKRYPTPPSKYSYCVIMGIT